MAQRARRPDSVEDSGPTDGRPGAGPAAQLREALDAAGNERPVFLLSFPDAPELEPLIRAFESGNYAYVRAHSLQIAAATADPAVRAAALELRRRIEPDPLAKYLLAGAALLLLILVGWAYSMQPAHLHQEAPARGGR